MGTMFSYIISKLIRKIQIPAIKDSYVSSTSKINNMTNVYYSNINNYTYIGSNCSIIHTEIGKFCSIADNVIIGGANHTVEWISTSPVFNSRKNILKQNFSDKEFNPYLKTIIGNDVWIGNNCLIKAGVSIGNGAVIGMGSVVTKNINSYEIWAGNPAKKIRMRFEDEIANKVEQSLWWNYDTDELFKLGLVVDDVNKFISSIGEFD